MIAPRLLLGLLALLATAVVVATGIAVAEARRPAPQVATVAVTPAPDRTGAVAALAAWDRERAAAWAAGDPAALAALYAPGSPAGRVDVAMLRRWVGRGLRVAGMAMQVRAVEVRSATARSWDLVVTDRLAGGVAVGRRTRTALPHDGWSTRRVVLARSGGRWRVVSVSAPPGRP